MNGTTTLSACAAPAFWTVHEGEVGALFHIFTCSLARRMFHNCWTRVLPGCGWKHREQSTSNVNSSFSFLRLNFNVNQTNGPPPTPPHARTQTTKLDGFLVFLAPGGLLPFGTSSHAVWLITGGPRGEDEKRTKALLFSPHVRFPAGKAERARCAIVSFCVCLVQT